MNPFQAVGSVIINTFNFFSRAPRSEYWWWFFFVVIALVVVACYDAYTIILAIDPQSTAENPIVNLDQLPTTTLWFIALTFLPNLSVTIRRLHDVGFSGWWYLLSLIPFGGLVILVLMFFPSERYPNKWGPRWGEKRLPGADIFNDEPIDSTPELYQPGNLLGPEKGAKIASREEQQAANRAEISSYYKKRVLAQQQG